MNALTGSHWAVIQYLWRVWGGPMTVFISLHNYIHTQPLIVGYIHMTVHEYAETITYIYNNFFACGLIIVLPALQRAS